jgi:iron(III) transport system permease protein
VPLRVVSLAIALVFAAPLGYLLWGNLAEGDYVAALTSTRLLLPLANTLILATSVSIGAAVVGTTAAWLVTRTDVPAARLWRVVLPLPLVIPSFIGAFAIVAAFAPGGLVQQLLDPLVLLPVSRVRGMPWAVGVLIALTYPYVYLPVAARLRQLPPSLEEAARLLGRRPRQVFIEVVVPQVRGAILAGTLLVFLYAVSEYGAVEVLRVETLTRAVFTAYRSMDLPTALGLSLNLGLLALLVVVLERLTTQRGTSVERSVRGLQWRLGRWRPVATLALVAVVSLCLLAPIGVLISWAARGFVSAAGTGSAGFADPGSLVEPAWNTARVSLAAAFASVVVAWPIAALTVRYRGRAGAVANAFVVVGFALPGVAIALAVTFWTLGSSLLTGLYQTVSLLVVTYVIHFGAQSLRAAEVAVASVPARLDEAARVLGAKRLRRLLAVELPLMAPGLLAGAGLVLLSVMKELPATLLLAPPGFQTLATKVWQSTQDAFLADASLAALVLIALSGVLTWVLVVRRSDAV